VSLDPSKNFAISTLPAGITNADVSFNCGTGDGAKFPAPGTDGPFNIVIWNSTDYATPAQDPSVEVLRVTARTADAFTITRAQEGTSAVAHNTVGKTYKIVLALTAKTLTDINTTLVANSAAISTLQTQVSTGIVYYAADTGIANTYLVAPNPAAGSYYAGLTVTFKAGNTQTGACTLNVNGLGTKNIKVYQQTSLADPPANSIVAGAEVTCVYDGTQFLLTAGLPVLTPGLRLVSSSSPSAASSLALTGLTAGTRYRVELNLVWNTSAGDLRHTFNNDSGANYFESAWYSSAGGNFTYSGSSTFGLLSGGGPIKVGEQIIADFEFQTMPGTNTKAQLVGKSGYLRNSATDQIVSIFSTKYTGASNVTEVDLVASAGTFTGTVLLYALNG
jgi:hypothetical protein